MEAPSYVGKKAAMLLTLQLPFTGSLHVPASTWCGHNVPVDTGPTLRQCTPTVKTLMRSVTISLSSETQLSVARLGGGPMTCVER